MLSVTTTQRLRKRRVGSPAQLGLQSLLVASPLSAAVSLAVPFLFRHASTNHHGRIWPCVIRRPTRAGGHAIGDVFVTPSRVRKLLQDLLSANTALGPELRDNHALKQKVLIPMSAVIMHLPMTISNYTDFFVGLHHALNVRTGCRVR